MIERLKYRLKQPFPFYFNSHRGNLIMLLSIVAFVATFMYFFDPRGTEPMDNEFAAILGYCLITAVVLGAVLFVLPAIFPGYFDPEKFTFGKYLLVNLICVEIITLFITPFNQIVVWPDNYYCTPCMLSDHRSTYMVAFIVLLPASYMIKAWVLSQNLQLAQETNEKLLRQRKGESQVESTQVIIEADTKEQITLLPDTFLFAEAQDNYVRLFWQEEGAVKDKMLRLSLSRLEEQIAQRNIVRSHRSYMVNLEKVTQVKGNSNGLRLALEGYDFEVPVSRSHAQAIRDRLPDNGS